MRLAVTVEFACATSTISLALLFAVVMAFNGVGLKIARGRERNASPHTIASYRDTIRLLLTYASQELGVEPSRLDLGQLDARLIAAFLDHLETERGCGARTRNTRLAAIRTFYRYCLVRHPEHAATIERVL